jgi:hypothetical protein
VPVPLPNSVSIEAAEIDHPFGSRYKATDFEGLGINTTHAMQDKGWEFETVMKQIDVNRDSAGMVPKLESSACMELAVSGTDVRACCRCKEDVFTRWMIDPAALICRTTFPPTGWQASLRKDKTRF